MITDNTLISIGETLREVERERRSNSAMLQSLLKGVQEFQEYAETRDGDHLRAGAVAIHLQDIINAARTAGEESLRANDHLLE